MYCGFLKQITLGNNNHGTSIISKNNDSKPAKHLITLKSSENSTARYFNKIVSIILYGYEIKTEWLVVCLCQFRTLSPGDIKNNDLFKKPYTKLLILYKFLACKLAL